MAAATTSATTNQQAPPPSDSTREFGKWVRATVIGLLVGAAVGALCTIGYVAWAYELHAKVASKALVLYQEPTSVFGYCLAFGQGLRSIWSYWKAVAKPLMMGWAYKVYCGLLTAVDAVFAFARSSALWYDWIFLAHWAGRLGYSTSLVYRGEFSPPHCISFDPIREAALAVDWTSLAYHSSETISVRRVAKNEPRRLMAYWALEGTNMRLIGFGYIGKDVSMLPPHMVTGNGSIVHYLKLGINVVVTKAHARIEPGIRIVPLPRDMCDCLVSGRWEAWLAMPPKRPDGEYRAADDHCLLRFPNLNTNLGVRAGRTAFAPGKATFVPVRAFEYVLDEDTETYVLYEQLGCVYNKQPAKGLLATSLTSVPGMSGSILFDPLSDAVVGMNIGCADTGDGEPVAIAVNIRQIYVYWMTIDPGADKSTFSWPKSRPTVSKHSGDRSPQEDEYWEIDPYEEMAEDMGYSTDFVAGDWQTAEEVAAEAQRERDTVAMRMFGDRNIDYTDGPGGFRLLQFKKHSNAARPADHHLAESGRLTGFTSLPSGVGYCFCCSAATAFAFCAGCSGMLNLQHRAWTVEPVAPEGFVPFSPLEAQLIGSISTMVPVPFAKDKAGTDFLFEVGRSRYKRVYNASCGLELPPAELLNTLGLSETYYIPDRSAAGVRSSLIANCSKRLVGNFGESADHWVTLLEPTADADVHFPVQLPVLTKDLYRSVYRCVALYSQEMKLNKSAGWSGAVLGCPQKVDLMAKHREDVLDMATRRICRFLQFPEFAASLGPIDLIRFGFRGLVLPEIKGELHPKRKVIGADGQRLDNPFWRSILMQDTADHLVHMFFESGFNEGLIRNYQQGELDSVVAYGSLVGLSTNAEGITRMHAVLSHLAGLPSGLPRRLRTSDVSGMDWCLGASDVMAAAAVRAQRILLSESPHRRRLALGTYVASLAEARAVYLVEDRLYAANETGVCQTGAFSTSEIDGFARVADARLRDLSCEVMAYGDDSVRSQLCTDALDLSLADVHTQATHAELLKEVSCLAPFPCPGYVSALDERDVVPNLDYEAGDAINVCSRDFSTDNVSEFQLTSYQRCLTRLAGITCPDKFAESAGGLLVECRYTDPALRGMATIAAFRNFSQPCAATNHNIDDYV